MPIDLPGVNAADNELHISTDYGTGSPKPYRVLSNAQSQPRQYVAPAARQTLGRAASMFAFSDPLGRSSFLKDDTLPPELPQGIRRAD